MQTVNLSYNRGWNKYGLIFNHIVQNPTQIVTASIENLGLRTIKWEDFSYGIQSRYRYRNILFSANLEFVTKNDSLTKENKVERKNNRKEYQSKLNSILTKEQQEKAKSLMKENQKKRRENRK
jgi:hypothetical protein